VSRALIRLSKNKHQKNELLTQYNQWKNSISMLRNAPMFIKKMFFQRDRLMCVLLKQHFLK
jgi:hypothetical protein